jgi:hypothetical protein
MSRVYHNIKTETLDRGHGKGREGRVMLTRARIENKLQVYLKE